MTQTSANQGMFSLYASRRRRNRLAMGLSIGATIFGLAWLALILTLLVLPAIYKWFAIVRQSEGTSPRGGDA